MKDRKVFDTGLYTGLAPEVSHAVITEDLAGVVIEAGNAPLEQRVNRRTFKIVDGKIFDTISGKELHLTWDHSTRLASLESTAAHKFYSHLLSKPNSLVLSVSPSGGISPYLESRINVGYRNGDTVEFHGIPSNLTPENCLYLAARLGEFSSLNFYSDNPDDLRSIAIPIDLPQGTNPYMLLQMVAPLDSDAWGEILKGGPQIRKNKALIDARIASRELDLRIRAARNEWDLVYAGAQAEIFMRNQGWGFSGVACPGKFNLELLGMSFGSQTISFDAFGNARKTRSEKHFDCPRCDGPIESGKGITKCPHCGITKEEAGSTCV